MDIFTSPHDPTKPWINIAWLIDTIMYGGYELGGWTLLAASKTFIIAGAVALIAWTAHRSGRSALFIPVVLLVLNIHRPRFILRPFLVSSLLTALTIGLVERERRRFMREGTARTRGLWWLVPITWFWASTHGAFVMVWCFLGAYGLEVLLQHRPTPDASTEAKASWRRYFGNLMLLGLACVGITLVQPYGWAIYSRIGELFSSSYIMATIGEWQPLLGYVQRSSGLAGNWWGLCFTLLISFLLLGKRISVFRLLAAVGPGYLAFTAVRHLDVFLYCAAPIAIANLNEAYDARPRLRTIFSSNSRLGHIWVLCVLLTISWQTRNYFSKTILVDGQRQPARTWDVAWTNYAKAPMEHLQTHPVSGRLFNEFEQGGFLYWHLAPYPVYIDSKGLDDRQMSRHENVLFDEAVFDEAVVQEDIRAIAMTLSPKRASLYTRLLARPEWTIEAFAPSGYLATRRQSGAIPSQVYPPTKAAREDIIQFVPDPLPQLDPREARDAPFAIEHDQLAKFWTAVGMPRRAASSYRDALRASPQHVPTRVNYAIALLELGMLREALAIADSLSGVSDRGVRSSMAFLRARIAYLTGDISSALVYANEVGSGEWSEAGFQLRVQLHLLTNDLEGAAAEARSWRQQHRQSWAALNASAHVDQLRGDIDAALKHVEAGLTLAPSQAELWRTKGNIFQAKGETAKAADAFAKAKHFDVTQSPRSP